MKNLKKVLAVVLVVVMAVGLMTVASAKTSFTDDKDIKYVTAVGVMSGIGAINGYTDGTFAPKGEVTRAEAAKMVAYAILGPNVAAALKTNTTSFTDVPATHWASPYIEYCVAHGILNGRGDGTFDPNGKVTAFEIAKMMLCAAGYGENDEYVGPNWSINVASDGMTKNVFKGNESGNFASPATREEAALYIFNGIYRVKQADYNEMFGYYPKNGSVTTDWDSAVVKTIAQDTYKMDTVSGIVLGGSVTDVGVTGTNISKAEFDKQTNKLIKLDASATNYKFEATAADLGQLVDIYVNESSGKVFYTETASKAVSAIMAATTPTTFNNTFGSLTMNTATAVYTFKANYTGNSLVTGTASNRPVFTGSFAGTPNTFAVGTSAPAGTYAIYEGEIVAYAESAKTTFDKVLAISTAKGAESITFMRAAQLSNSAAKDVIAEYKDIAVNDYVTLKQIGSKYVADKVTTVSGSISGIRNFGIFGEWYITLDGKEYTKSGASDSASGQTPSWLDLTQSYPKVTDFSKNTYTLYLDAAGNWITCVLKSGANASSVVYVTGPSWSASSDYGQVQKVQAVNVAGEQVVYTLKQSAPHPGTGFYKVNIDSTTGLATLDAPNAMVNGVQTDDYVKASAAIEVKANAVTNQPNYYYDPDVKFVFVSGSGANLKINVVTGLAAVVGLNLDATDMLFVRPTTNQNKTITTVIVTDVFKGATTGATLYVDNDATIDSYNGSNTMYNVYIDGVMTKITAKDAALTDVDGNKTSVVGKFASYSVDSNNVYDLTGVSSASNVYAQKIVAKGAVYNNYFATVDGINFNATGATVIDLSQAPFEPLLYTSVAALAAASATKGFMLSFVTDATTGLVKYIYVEQAMDYVWSGNGVYLTATKTTKDTSDIFTVTFKGTLTVDTKFVTNGTWADEGAAPANYWSQFGITKSVDNHTINVTKASSMAGSMGVSPYFVTIDITVPTGTTPTIAISNL